MGRVNTDRHSGQPLDDRDVGEIHQVPMGISQVGLNPPQAKYHLAIPLTGNIFAGIERFLQGNTHSTFEQHGKLALLAHYFK